MDDFNLRKKLAGNGRLKIRQNRVEQVPAEFQDTFIARRHQLLIQFSTVFRAVGFHHQYRRCVSLQIQSFERLDSSLVGSSDERLPRALAKKTA